MVKIAIIGFGHMAQALIEGLLKLQNVQIYASAPSLNVATQPNGVNTHSDNTVIIQDADVIILAIKPARTALVLAEIKHKISQDSIVVSIVAGLSLAWLAERLPNETPIIRAIPNVLAKVNEAATPLSHNKWATAQHKALISRLFKQLGLITWVINEQDIDAFTALSGSGPAYVLLFLNAMINAGIALGIAPVDAKNFAIQTIQGTLHWAQSHPTQSLDELSTLIATPGGTTAAALKVLHQTPDLEEKLKQALRAAFERAQELKEESSCQDF